MLNRNKQNLLSPIKPREPFRLDLVPMINIVFLLLVFFMLTSSAFRQSEKIELPEAESGELKSEHNIVVLVTANGRVEYEGEPHSLDSLLSVLEGDLYERERKVVEIQADKNVEYQLFGEVIDIAKQAGAKDFILATEAVESSEE